MGTFVPRMNNLPRHKLLTIFFGFLTAGAVIMSQTFFFQASNIKKEKARTEQDHPSDQSAETESYVCVPDSSIPSTFSVQLNQELSFVLQILLNDDQDDETYYRPAISAGQLFHTLFSALISPNAP
jgi:hypothetical protein